MMSTSWRDEQRPSCINFISSFFDANSFRLNFVPISPASFIYFLLILGFSIGLRHCPTMRICAQDFIFNCGGLSVAFVFVTKWDCNNDQHIFSGLTLVHRAEKLKGQFAHLYIVLSLPTRDQNDSFVRSYFKYQMEIGKPTFVVVQDVEMGFEKMVKLAHSRGICKQHDAKSKIKAERTLSMQRMDAFLKVVTAIPGIDNHDANALNQAIGSIEAITKARKEYILENTDLSAHKAEVLTRFFRDPKFYLGPKIN